MASEEVCYHVAGSDKELVQQVNNLLQEEGAIFVRDKLGNSHYLIDGSRGAQQAGKVIQRQNLLREVLAPRQWASSFQLDHYQEKAIYQELEQWLDRDRLVDEVLNRHPFDRSLQGYSILKYALACLIPDQSLMKPVKGLYHLCAQEHQTSVVCVERNLRSLFKKLAAAEHGAFSQEPQPYSYKEPSRAVVPLLEKREQYTNVNCLCRLFDEMYRAFRGYQSRKEGTSQATPTSAALTVRDVAQGKYSFDLKPQMGLHGIHQLAAAYEKYLAAEESYRLEGTAQGQVRKDLLLAKFQSVFAALHQDFQYLLSSEEEKKENLPKAILGQEKRSL